MEFKSRRKQQFRKKGESAAAEEDGAPSSTPSTPSATPTSTPAATPTPATPTPATPTPDTSAPSTPATSSSTAATPTSTPTNGTKSERNEKPKPKLLSFGDDEEAEEEFQVKKTNRSKMMSKEVKESKTRPFHRELPPVVSTATAALSGGAGEYTPEKMEELRKNAMAYTRPKQETPTATEEKEPELPTAAQIHAARERRKGVREGKDGFIPLEEDKGVKGRLIREEGEDDDVDEEGRGSESRIEFGDKKGKGAKDVRQVITVDDEEAEDDEELKRWEMDRIRKGVGAQEMKRKDLVDKARNKSPARPGLDLGRKSAVTIDTITKDIKSTLAALQDAHRAHNTQLERIKEELIAAQEASESMKEQVKEGSDEYTFFADMKGYVQVLLDCLGAKAELVEQAEDKQMAAYRVRTAKNRTYAQRKRDAQAQEMKQIADEIAGYHKGTGAKPRPRTARTDQKKRAREHEEGWSSDSESEEVNREFEKANGEARDIGGSVFADVDEKYGKIVAVKERFERWKREFPNSYKMAYISISMPQLFSPFVRLQLLAREPLRAGLDTMDWFKELFAFGMGDTGEPLEDDEDNFLVPKLVEKVVVPRIHNALSHVWNPQSRTSNARALAAVQEALDYTDAFAPHMKELFAAVLGTLQTSVQEVHIPMYHYPKDKDIGSQLPWDFSCKMMWRAIKLLKNITAWHEIVAAGPLQQLAIDTLITSKILPFLRTLRAEATVPIFLDAYESIVNCLPATWTQLTEEEKDTKKSGGEEQKVRANLAIFHDPLLSVTNKLAEEDRRERNGNKEREKERKKLLEIAVRALDKLGDKDNSSLIARATGIKI